jgi:GNAT superfamily N-acetyltransferase
VSLPNGLIIRTATEADLPVLHRLADQSLDLDTFSPDLLREKLWQNPNPDQFAKWAYAAEIGGEIVGFMQAVQRCSQAKGWLGVFGVAPGYRRQGVASAMFEKIVGEFRAASVTEVEALAIPGNYFTPGIDPRYTSGLSFLEARGFERFKDCVNMIALLPERYDTSDDEARLAGQGIEVRRADENDAGLLDAFFAGDFGADWRMEAELAMRNDPPALHLAIKEGRIIAFSGHSSQNREWGFFGPMGTTPEARGTVAPLPQRHARRGARDVRDSLGRTNRLLLTVRVLPRRSRVLAVPVGPVKTIRLRFRLLLPLLPAAWVTR